MYTLLYNQSPELFRLAELTLYPLNISSLVHPLPDPWQPPFYLLLPVSVNMTTLGIAYE